MRQLDPLQLVRQAGIRVASKGAADRLSSRRVYLGLRCELAELPEPRRAKVPLEMTARDASAFDGFTDELRSATGNDYVQVLLRTWMCTSDVQTLYVADADDGRPVYAQWLVRRPDQWRLQAETPDAHDALADDEVLLEGAYTFVAFRGVGAMADGMGQLLRIARATREPSRRSPTCGTTTFRPCEAVPGSGSASTTSASTRRASAAAGVPAARSRPRRSEPGTRPSGRRCGPDAPAGLGRRRRPAADYESGARRRGLGRYVPLLLGHPLVEPALPRVGSATFEAAPKANLGCRLDPRIV